MSEVCSAQTCVDPEVGVLESVRMDAPGGWADRALLHQKIIYGSASCPAQALALAQGQAEENTTLTHPFAQPAPNPIVSVAGSFGL